MTIRDMEMLRVIPDGWGHLGEPPTVRPERSDLFTGSLFGRRVILDAAEGHLFDMRAVGELVPSDQWPGCPGGVRIHSEAAWYAWLMEGKPGEFPRGCAVWPATMVYVER